MFDSEEHFLSVIDEHDQLIQDCAIGAITFHDFLDRYNDFNLFYALDGHESDEHKGSCLRAIRKSRKIWQR